MPYPPLSSRRQRKLLNIARRVLALFEALGDDAVRNGQLSAETAGAWRRTLSEAGALLGSDFLPDSSSRRPADFFAAVLLKLHALTRLKRLEDKASRANSRRSYPRSLRRV